MPKPMISVIIPTYNHGAMLARSIDSVLAQDFDGFEIIVSNDGSTDSTLEILSRYDDQIVVVNGDNQGCATARSRAIEIAQGKFIVNHDADDIMLPGRLMMQYEFMQANDNIAVVSGNIVVQGDEQTNYLEKCGVNFNKNPWIVFEKPFQKLLHRNFMTDPASMIRRECFSEIGGYDLSLKRSADWDLWLKMARRWPLACMNYPCTWVGKHEDNRITSLVEIKCNMRIIDRGLSYGETIEPSLMEEILRQLYRTIIRYILRNLKNSQDQAWKQDAVDCAQYLPWPRRLAIYAIAAFPDGLLRFSLGCIRPFRTLFKRILN